jgi:hypothetical protein
VTILLYVLMMPLASDFIASLLGLRDGGSDGGHIPWRLVRVLMDALILLTLILWLGDPATYAIGAALMTVVIMELIGFFAWRWLFIGIRKS